MNRCRSIGHSNFVVDRRRCLRPDAPSNGQAKRSPLRHLSVGYLQLLVSANKVRQKGQKEPKLEGPSAKLPSFLS